MLWMLLLGFLPGVVCFALAVRMQPIDGERARTVTISHTSTPYDHMSALMLAFSRLTTCAAQHGTGAQVAGRSRVL